MPAEYFHGGFEFEFFPGRCMGAWLGQPPLEGHMDSFPKKKGAGLAIHMRENVYKKNLPCQHSWSISQNPDQKKISFGSLGALCSFDEIEFVILNDI